MTWPRWEKGRILDFIGTAWRDILTQLRNIDDPKSNDLASWWWLCLFCFQFSLRWRDKSSNDFFKNHPEHPVNGRLTSGLFVRRTEEHWAFQSRGWLTEWLFKNYRITYPHFVLIVHSTWYPLIIFLTFTLGDHMT